MFLFGYSSCTWVDVYSLRYFKNRGATRTMIGQIVDVEFEEGFTSIAKIIEDTGTEYHVVVLENAFGGIYKFSDSPEVIPKEAISGFYDTTNLEETGLFTDLDGTYYESCDQSDYECETDDESTDTDVTLEDEDELLMPPYA